MFDINRFQERVQVIVNNMRNTVNCKCIGDANKLLDSNELMQNCIAPSLEAYDQELGAMFEQYQKTLNEVFALKESLAFHQAESKTRN